MGLDKPPPSRYRIEEKDGRLIVHDSMRGDQMTPAAPEPQPRSSLDATSLTPSASPLLSSPSLSSPTSVGGGVDSGKAKRGATVAALGIGLALFLIATRLWPMMVVALVVAPIRKQLLGSVLPAVKRYVDEGSLR